METKRELLVSKAWIQGVALVGLCGFLLLGILAYRTYTDEPPIPAFAAPERIRNCDSTNGLISRVSIRP